MILPRPTPPPLDLTAPLVLARGHNVLDMAQSLDECIDTAALLAAALHDVATLTTSPACVRYLRATAWGN